MRLALLHPLVATRSCGDCKKWVYEDSGELKMRNDEPMERPAGTPTPCGSCPKIPKGRFPKPENAQELSEKNWRAFGHYRECKAVGRFPDDPIVRVNAGIIRMVEDQVQDTKLARLPEVMARMLGEVFYRGRP